MANRGGKLLVPLEFLAYVVTLRTHAVDHGHGCVYRQVLNPRVVEAPRGEGRDRKGRVPDPRANLVHKAPIESALRKPGVEIDLVFHRIEGRAHFPKRIRNFRGCGGIRNAVYFQASHRHYLHAGWIGNGIQAAIDSQFALLPKDRAGPDCGLESLGPHETQIFGAPPGPQVIVRRRRSTGRVRVRIA